MLNDFVIVGSCVFSDYLRDSALDSHPKASLLPVEASHPRDATLYYHEKGSWSTSELLDYVKTLPAI